MKKNNANPRGIIITAAIAMGKVLNGLIAIRSQVKNKGDDWYSTVSMVNTPPIDTNLLTLIVFI